MEEEPPPTDPHEQQLFLVYKSCLTKGQNKLSKDGLLDLCCKLELDQNHKETILDLLKIETNKNFISFCEFRDAFVILLDKSQNTLINGKDKEVNGESDDYFKINAMCTRYNHRSKNNKKKKDLTNCQEVQTDDINDLQSLQHETYSNQNSLIDVNRDFVFSKHVS